MVEILRDEGNLAAFRLSGTLHDEDYQKFVPVVQAAAAKGKLHMLVEFADFHGWDARALWDVIQLDANYGKQIERLALVGDKRWEQWMAKICRPFTSAMIQYFDDNDSQNAWAWVQDGLEQLRFAQLFYLVIQSTRWMLTAQSAERCAKWQMRN
jgi:SpoIIAA-like